MIRDTVNEAVAEAMAEVKSLLEKTATKKDVKELQDQIDAHQKAIAAHDGRIEQQKQRIEEESHKLDLFKKAIEDATGRMEKSVSGAVDMMTRRDEQYHERISQLDKRITGTEQANTAQSEEITSINKDVGDMRTRYAEGFKPLQDIVLGDIKTNRPGILTTLETTNHRIDETNKRLNDIGAGFVAEITALNNGVKPLVQAQQEKTARKELWKARRKALSEAVFSRRGMAMIGASLPIVVPIAVRWIQANINLHPALMEILNQINQVISLYAGK